MSIGLTHSAGSGLFSFLPLTLSHDSSGCRRHVFFFCTQEENGHKTLSSITGGGDRECTVSSCWATSLSSEQEKGIANSSELEEGDSDKLTRN
jgi:hypothetical protein